MWAALYANEQTPVPAVRHHIIERLGAKDTLPTYREYDRKRGVGLDCCHAPVIRYPANVKRKRIATSHKNRPNAISSLRRGSTWAMRAPHGAASALIGAISTKPSSDTKPIESGGSKAWCGNPARMNPIVPTDEMMTPMPADKPTAT